MRGSASVLKINKVFSDTLIRKSFFKIMKINNFRGDFTDISAKKEALMRGFVRCIERISNTPENAAKVLIQFNLYVMHASCFAAAMALAQSTRPETTLHVWWSTHAYVAFQLQYIAVHLLATNPASGSLTQ